MAVVVDALHVPPRPWHRLGFDFLTNSNVSANFVSVLVVVDHFTRMAHLFPYYTKEIITSFETTYIYF
jgi:hypothetical protein